MILDYKTAKENFLVGQFDDCQRFFAQNGFMLEEGYCELVADNLERATALFEKIKNIDIRAHWGLYLISMIQLNPRICPTYFELRNFLEIDLNILLTYYKGDYVEKIIRYADFMFTINPEVHKFIGRVLYNNGYNEQGMFFLDRAKNYFYHDPELHYLLAYIYYNHSDYAKSERSANDCLYILPNYFPAVSLLKKIKERNK